jgi:tetratricopeptide (TPR) repeat protein
MAKILKMPSQPPARLGFKRVQKRKARDVEQDGQLNLFNTHPQNQGNARIVSIPKPLPLSSFDEALRLDEQGIEKAREFYERAIREGDSVADAYCNLGILEFRSGKTDTAFDCFTRSLREDPRHMESHYNLGNLYFEIGNLRLACEHYNIAAQIAPDFPNIYFNLGLAYAMNEDLNAAIEALFRFKDLVSEADGHQADELLQNLKQTLALR